MKIPISPEDLTSEWLTEALREGGAINQVRVTSVATEVMGDEEGLTGTGQMARLRLTFDRAEADAPQSLVAKLSSPDPVHRAELHALEMYEREVLSGVGKPGCFAHTALLLQCAGQGNGPVCATPRGPSADSVRG